MRFFVTGASGWVGSAVVPELLGAGHAVVGLARSDASAAALEAAGAEVVRGSLDDLEVLGDAAASSDGVIHLAYKHEQMFSGDAATAMEADGAAIARFGEALAGSDRPLVIASGLAGHSAGRRITEADVADTGNRADAERQLLDLAGSGVRAVSVRLSPTVHGEGDNGFVHLIADAARQHGVAPYAGDGSNHWAAVHRSDAARLFRLAAESAAPGTVLHGVAEEGVPMRDIAGALGAQLGVPSRSSTQEELAAQVGFLAHFIAMDVRASSARTRELLGWEPSGPTLLEDLRAGHYTS